MRPRHLVAAGAAVATLALSGGIAAAQSDDTTDDTVTTVPPDDGTTDDAVTTVPSEDDTVTPAPEVQEDVAGDDGCGDGGGPGRAAPDTTTEPGTATESSAITP